MQNALVEPVGTLCSCTGWLQQAAAAASHGLHAAYEDCIGSAAGAVLAALLLSLQMHSLGMHFHNLASSEIKCTLKQGNLVYETLYHSTF